MLSLQEKCCQSPGKEPKVLDKQELNAVKGILGKSIYKGMKKKCAILITFTYSFISYTILYINKAPPKSKSIPMRASSMYVSRCSYSYNLHLRAAFRKDYPEQCINL